MIKIEHVVLPSLEQMDFVIEGMRNPKNSWDRSDSCAGCYVDENDHFIPGHAEIGDFYRCDECLWVPPLCECKPQKKIYNLGPNDLKLMTDLSNGGPVHSKYLRMMPVMVRITAGHTFWAEMDTYKVGTVRNSCSKMHKIQSVEFSKDCLDHEGIDEVGGHTLEVFESVIDELNYLSKMFNETKEYKYWRALIELLPLGFNLTANLYLNYEVLKNIYTWRKNHKMFEWRELCKWIESLPYSELITGGNVR